ncbi:hypothetical protein N181_29210 [Sinorhizobium fredii USDA 205]|uniref:Uncharacterized protein n=2 Tax=Rhizobium fredii TaxID=380 RepID=A0A844A4F2_RHIFR|nr:hypothetical protein [Sinorhizobium fredii]AWM27259.1 hypothetical protein AOX55_00004036 [Sinorhizobium fredii CCBAU 25509]KSV80443.1 hypothetical protein N181_29210 [Sinorhizobium fredii USDA 205]MCG5476551.1 hypothetical protein [Sinorhizobium fredii]MQX07111.1 hypothetical protein [Sinorhizobium fredii]UTY51250.1 hypothetical protein EPK84_33080 [Sinorhizobium fredii]
MAKKNRIPKKIAGVKVPKTLRKSKVLGAMMASKVGRDLLAKALTAGAGAAAAVLVNHTDEVGETARKTTRKGARALGLAREAAQSGFSAAMDVVKESVLPSPKKKGNKKSGKSKAAAGRAALH